MKPHQRLFEDSTHLYMPRQSLRNRGPLTSGMLDIARCPLCRAALVAKIGSRGPGFYCLCPVNDDAGKQRAPRPILRFQDDRRVNAGYHGAQQPSNAS